MVDATLSAAAGRMIGLLEEQARYHLNLVRGAEEQIRSLARELRTIRCVLDDAENRRFKEETVNLWLSRLEHTSFIMEDVLDEWNYAILKLGNKHEKVCSFVPSSLCLCFKKAIVRHGIAKKILNVKDQLDKILEEKDNYKFVVSQPATSLGPLPEFSRIQTTSFIDLEKVHGRDADRDFLVSRVLDEGAIHGESPGIPILSIVGVGGLGKTTLAQQVYNDTRVEQSFGKLRIWVCVSDPFDPAAIAKSLLEKIEGSSPNSNELDDLLHRLTESLLGKKFLLVLDDVWTEDGNKWEPPQESLRRCGSRTDSKILVTTRNERVAKIMGSSDSGIYKPGFLSDEDCWSLMCRVALSERNEIEFKEIGMKIVQKCNGLPLAVKNLGSLLRFKKSLHEWENVLKSEIWEIKEVEGELFPHLLLSYNELSPPIKRCFSYCAVYPKDFEIDIESLIRDWMALGYLGSDDKCEMEIEGGKLFDVLATRSLFQDFNIKDELDESVECCKMHDIVHDFAQFLRKKGSMVEGAVETNKATCGVCDPLLFSKIIEFRSLECEEAEYPSNICDCLVHLRVLSLVKQQQIPRGMVKLIHLRNLKLFSIDNISPGDLENICQLYHLQTLIFNYCNVRVIPRQIKNLIHLRHLGLRGNDLEELPNEIEELINLRQLDLRKNESLIKLPEGLRQLSSLRSLKGIFKGGSGRSKLGILKKLNNLGGELELIIRLDDDLLDCDGIVEDAGEAELRNKRHLKELCITFVDEISDERSSSRDSVRIGVVDALQPHPNLQQLTIWHYEGSKLPTGWMVSPLNLLKKLELCWFCKLTSLPTLGRLPCLEDLHVWKMDALERVGREFTGIGTEEDENIGVSNTRTISNLPPIAFFPKLKKLEFFQCPKWKEWEDIRAEEEEPSFSCMPSLTALEITRCGALTALPHHLLRKATSLQVINICYSPELAQRYREKEAPHWKSISINNPNLQLEID